MLFQSFVCILFLFFCIHGFNCLRILRQNANVDPDIVNINKNLIDALKRIGNDRIEEYLDNFLKQRNNQAFYYEKEKSGQISELNIKFQVIRLQLLNEKGIWENQQKEKNMADQIEKFKKHFKKLLYHPHPNVKLNVNDKKKQSESNVFQAMVFYLNEKSLEEKTNSYNNQLYLMSKKIKETKEKFMSYDIDQESSNVYFELEKKLREDLKEYERIADTLKDKTHLQSAYETFSSLNKKGLEIRSINILRLYKDEYRMKEIFLLIQQNFNEQDQSEYKNIYKLIRKKKFKDVLISKKINESIDELYQQVLKYQKNAQIIYTQCEFHDQVINLQQRTKNVIALPDPKKIFFDDTYTYNICKKMKDILEEGENFIIFKYIKRYRITFQQLFPQLMKINEINQQILPWKQWKEKNINIINPLEREPIPLKRKELNDLLVKISHAYYNYQKICRDFLKKEDQMDLLFCKENDEWFQQSLKETRDFHAMKSKLFSSFPFNFIQHIYNFFQSIISSIYRFFCRTKATNSNVMQSNNDHMTQKIKK